MRIASYNVENLFDRPEVMNLENWADGEGVLAGYARLNALFGKSEYLAEDKTEMVEILRRLRLDRSDQGEYVTLRQNRGRLLRRNRGSIDIVASGRHDWVGWLELNVAPVDARATTMTARVIKDVAADILGVVEAESRTALLHFNEEELEQGATYQHVMLIKGRDQRNIDVGLMARDAYPIISMRSHVDDIDGHGPIFSRDCAEYEIELPSGHRLWVLLNHFKSKGYGSQATSDARRKLQAARVRAIYDAHRRAGHELIVIEGDFNDTASNGPLQPLVGDASDLRDISDHPSFDDGGRPGTFGNCAASQKIDFILLSPALFERVTAGGIFRKGVWGGKDGDLFPHYSGMTAPIEAASDHAAIWASLDI